MIRHKRHALTTAAIALLLLACGPYGVVLGSPEFGLLSADPGVRRSAIAELRAEGQSGVDRLIALLPLLGEEEVSELTRDLDAVCGQRDCAQSGLFWHTDLEAARLEAERQGRPILSLRLLGRLDADRSCANSRFFRTALYADPQVATYLRQHFVLHWSSERPVPEVTIDFGDGRQLQGTITGNSVHYVLDAEGRVLDALPGLYGPGLFIERLRDLEALADRLAALPFEAFGAARAAYHQARATDLNQRLAGFLRPRRAAAHGPSGGPGKVGSAQTPTATEAAFRAVAKTMIEGPLLEAMSLTRPRGRQSHAVWQQVAEARSADWRLSQASRRFLVRKHGAQDPSAGERAIAAFESALALDTVRNEFQLHAEIHRWLAAPEVSDGGFEALNARIYRELFLTPADDPWLGMVSPDTYLALDIRRP